MIPATGIEDQELPIAAKWARVNDPSVAGRGDLCAGARRDRNTFLSSAEAVGSAELADPRPVHRHTEVPAGGGEGHPRSNAAGIMEGGEVRPPLPGSGGGVTSRAGRPVAARFELGDQVLQVVDLASEI